MIINIDIQLDQDAKVRWQLHPCQLVLDFLAYGMLETVVLHHLILLSVCCQMPELCGKLGDQPVSLMQLLKHVLGRLCAIRIKYNGHSLYKLFELPPTRG